MILKIIAIVLFSILLSLASPASSAAEMLKLSTNRVACTNIKDWIDLLSMKGRGDAVMPVLMDKINNGGCKRLYKGTEVRIEQHEDRKLADGSNLLLACAARVDISDSPCLWILDITAMIEQQ